MIGFSVWWYSVPEPLLLKPEALRSPDLKLLVNVAKDTFVDHVSSSHPGVSSPCEGTFEPDGERAFAGTLL